VWETDAIPLALVTGLLVAFAIEIASIYLLAPNMAWRPPCRNADERKRLREESNHCRRNALTMAGLTLAALSLLYGLSDSESSVTVDALSVLSFGFVFFLVSYSVASLSLERRMYWVIQDKTTAYGCLFMLAGVAILLTNVPSIAISVTVTGLVIVLVVHFLEFKSDLETAANESRNS
jgi:hypothetical protein